ncbi:MAG: hypothetical protein ABIC95_04770 [archaeon]
MTAPVIGVFGSSRGPFSDDLVRLAVALGKAVAEAGCTLLTGATTGLPFEASRGAKEAGGTVLGISPAKDRKDHISGYGMPVEHHDHIIYTGMDYVGRNVINVRSCDACVFIHGSVGTLQEFSIAYALEKPIGVLVESGGITDRLKGIIAGFDARYAPDVIYDRDQVSLVINLLASLKKDI